MTQLFYTTQDWYQLPAELDWLTPAEKQRLQDFRFDKRRRDWLLGRWAAKIALLRISGLSMWDIRRLQVDSATDGAPLPMLDGQPCAVELSLSHSHGRAFAAVSRGATALGCDIEFVEPRSDVFVDTYFTDLERVHVEDASPLNRDSAVTKIWSAKESTLKALRIGLKVDTRSVEVIDDGSRTGEDWGIARTVVNDAGEFACRWRLDRGFVLTIATRDPVEISRAH